MDNITTTNTKRGRFMATSILIRVGMSLFVLLVLLSSFATNVFSQSLLQESFWSSHDGAVEAMALSPDETIVASAGGAEGTIKLWNFADGSLRRTLSGQGYGLTFSSNGELLFSRDYDRTITIWRVSDGTVVRFWTESTGIYSIALSPDNSLVAAGTGTIGYPSSFDGAVRIWNTNGVLIRTLTNHISWVTSVVFSPDGQLLSAASAAGGVYVWHVSDGSLAWNIPAGIGGWSSKVAFSPDGQWLAYGFGSGLSYLGLRNVNTGAAAWMTNAHQNNLYGLAFSDDGKVLVSTGDRNGGSTPTIILWNPTDGSRIGTVPTPSDSVGSFAMTHSGDKLLTAEGGTAGLRLWHTNGVLLREWGGHSSPVAALAFSPNGNTLASDGGNGTVKLWSGTNGALLHTLEGYPESEPGGIAFSPDGSKLAYGNAWTSSFLELFRVEDGGLEWSQPLYPDRVSAIAYSPDCPMLAVSQTHGIITLRDESTGTAFQTISNLPPVVALAFFPSNRVAVLTYDGVARIWQTNGMLLQSFNVNTGFTCAAFSRDGTVLGVGYQNKNIELIGTSDGVVQRIFSGHVNVPQKIALSADGEMLFSAATNELLLWRVKDGALLKRYTEEVLSPASLTASPRGDLFAFGRTDDILFVSQKPDFFLPAQSANGDLLLKFSGVRDKNYTVETSADLQTWSFSTNVLCSGPAASVSIPISGSANRFYRMAR